MPKKQLTFYDFDKFRDIALYFDRIHLRLVESGLVKDPKKRSDER